jgi:hypothetical protein
LKAKNVAASAIVLTRDTSAITRAAFSPDGHTLATGNIAATVRLWPLELPSLIEQACRAAGRNLTLNEWRQMFGQEPYLQTCAQLPPHPSYIEQLLDDAAGKARQGQIADAIAAFAAAQRVNPQYVVGADYWDTLCRSGALWGHVKDVLEACGSAVALARETGTYHDSRGIARALIGDSTGAVEDFTAYVDWAKQQNAEEFSDAITRREAWIAGIKAGHKPLDDATLKGLREQEQ